MLIKHKLTMDLALKDEVAQICAVQGSSPSRALELTITENGDPWSIPEDISAVVTFRNALGEVGVYDTLEDGSKAWFVEDEKLIVILAPSLLKEPGCTMMQLQLTSGTDYIDTFEFSLAIDQALADGIVSSGEFEPYLNWNQWTISQLREMVALEQESGAFDGATFTPEVTEDGLLSWSNDQGKENPSPVDIVALLEALAEKQYLPITGGSMEGTLGMGGNRITSLGTPVNEADGVNKSYADNSFAPSGFGLGGSCTVVESWNDAIETGFYYPAADGPNAGKWFGYAIRNGIGMIAQVAYLYGNNSHLYHCQRTSADDGSTWSAWEWYNPLLAAGVEYQTPERWNNGRVVFTKLINCGTAADGKTVDTGLSSGTIIRHNAVNMTSKIPLPRVTDGDDNVYEMWVTVESVEQIAIWTPTGNTVSVYCQIWYIKD